MDLLNTARGLLMIPDLCLHSTSNGVIEESRKDQSYANQTLKHSQIDLTGYVKHSYILQYIGQML
jgi:hypothetical protein